MDYALIKVKLDDWVGEVIRLIVLQIPTYFSRSNQAHLCEVLEEYRTQVNTLYRGKEVPAPSKMAELFLQDVEFLLRDEEDKHLMLEQKTRTSPMTDCDWRHYCAVDYKTIVCSTNAAMITDGYYHTLKIGEPR